MKQKKMMVLPVLAVWAALVCGAWFLPDGDISEAERRPLAQRPALTAEALLDGSFMTDFEDWSLDQFPLRDRFRQLKALFHYGALQQKDNNGIYLADGFAVKQEYPLNKDSLQHALNRFDRVWTKYLEPAGSNVWLAMVPDKGYYLAQSSGHLSMDYEAMFDTMAAGMPWATPIDLTESLAGTDYYRTDTHWRQENLIPAAQTICQAMGVTGPEAADFTRTELERPFYGVYYGQAALPMEPETVVLMESELLDQCTVYDFESGKTLPVYDRTKLDSRDLYDVFLSGSRSLLTIENPNGIPGKELIIFRDSFGSSIAPLLVQDYAKVTLVDIRYIQIDMLERFVEFTGQDVLFLYSTLVINHSETIK